MALFRFLCPVCTPVYLLMPRHACDNSTRIQLYDTLVRVQLLFREVVSMDMNQDEELSLKEVSLLLTSLGLLLASLLFLRSLFF